MSLTLKNFISSAFKQLTPLHFAACVIRCWSHEAYAYLIPKTILYAASLTGVPGLYISMEGHDTEGEGFRQ